MSGRAGRTGFDSEGDSIMICKNDELALVENLMKPFMCELKSALTGCRLMRSILEIIASGLVECLSDIDFFLKNTLKYTLMTKEECSKCYK